MPRGGARREGGRERERERGREDSVHLVWVNEISKEVPIISRGVNEKKNVIIFSTP